MELNQLKEIWKEESKQLEQRIELSEALLRKMNLDKATGEFDKLLNMSILGRNLTLIFCLLSVMLSIQTWPHWQYCIPAIIGGIAMLWSFVSHLAIEKPDYASVSILSLQKAICKFRIHTISLQHYDTYITIFWVLATFAGVLFKITGIDVYSWAAPISVWIMLVSFVVFMILYSRYIYRYYDVRLKRSESQLEQILSFEKNTPEELP